MTISVPVEFRRRHHFLSREFRLLEIARLGAVSALTPELFLV